MQVSLEFEAVVCDRPDTVTRSADGYWVLSSAFGLVTAVDARGSAGAEVDVGVGATGICAFAGSAWVSRTERPVLRRVLAGGGIEDALSDVSGPLQGVGAGQGAVWAWDEKGMLHGLAGDRQYEFAVGTAPTALLDAFGSVWVVDAAGALTRLTVSRRGITLASQVRVGSGPIGLAATGDRVWVLCRADRTLVEVDSSGDPVVTHGIDGTPVALAVDGDHVFVLDRRKRVVQRFGRDGAGRHAPTGLIDVGRSPSDIAAAGGLLYVSLVEDATIEMVRWETPRERTRVPIGGQPDGLTADSGGFSVLDYTGGRLLAYHTTKATDRPRAPSRTDAQRSHRRAGSDEGRPVVFVSYSRADQRQENWVDRLHAFLAPYKAELDVWVDTKRIETGAPWRAEIEKALARAEVAVLLVGQHFLNSAFVDEVELPRLLARARDGGVRIVPVVVSYCTFDASPLSEYQTFNTPDEPLEDMQPALQNKTLVQLAQEVVEFCRRARDRG